MNARIRINAVEVDLLKDAISEVYDRSPEGYDKLWKMLEKCKQRILNDELPISGAVPEER